MKRKNIFFIVLVSFFQLTLGYKIPYERFEVVDEKEEAKTIYLVGWLKTEDPIGNEGVLVNIENPEFELENNVRKAIEGGTIKFIVPQAAKQDLPGGLYYWKTKSPTAKPVIQYQKFPEAKKDVGLPTIVAWESSAGKPGEKYTLQKKVTKYFIGEQVSEVYSVVFKASWGSEWKAKVGDFPSSIIQKLLLVIVDPDTIEKVDYDVDKSVPDKINVAEQDAITLEATQDKIDESVQHGLPYLVLRTVVKGGPKFYYYHFYDASNITNRQLLERGVYNPLKVDAGTNLSIEEPPRYYITYDPADKYFYPVTTTDIWAYNWPTGAYPIFVKSFLQYIFEQQDKLDKSQEVTIDVKKIRDIYKKALFDVYTAEEKEDIDDILKKYFAAQPKLVDTLKKENITELLNLVKEAEKEEQGQKALGGLWDDLKKLEHMISQVNTNLGLL